MAWNAIAAWPGEADGPGFTVGDPAPNGKVYAGSGEFAAGASVSTEMWVYDPVANDWTQLADLPVPRLNASALYVNGLVYVFGGASAAATSTDAVYVYDVAADTWDTRASMPDQRRNAAVARLGSIIYLFGGAGNGTFYGQVWAYSIPDDAWVTMGAAISPLAGGRATTLGDLIYIHPIGQSVTVYDPVTDAADTYEELPQSVVFVRGFAALGVQLFAWGGDAFGGEPTYRSTPGGEEEWVDILDPTPAPAIHNLSANGSTLFIFPTADGSGGSYRLDVDVVGSPGAATALNVIGQFRYHPRWHDLQEKWGGTTEEWDKVAAAGLVYDESTGSFRKGS